MTQFKLTRIMLLAIMLFFVRCGNKSQEKETTTSNNTSEKAVNQKATYVAPPLKNIKISKVNYAVNVEKGGSYEYKTGTKIIVPKDAFIDETGKVIKGKVDLSYREFRNPLDFFASGIPMTFNQNGQDFTFESAGMFEINASHKGKSVKINPGKEIEVKVTSSNQEKNFNRYVLDTTNRQWIELGKAEVNRAKQENQAAKGQNEKRQQQKTLAVKADKNLVKPIKPVLVDESKDSTLVINITQGDFPEMDAYKNVEFLVDKSFNISVGDGAKIRWEDVKITSTKKEGFYKITFFKGKQKAEYLVRPAFKGGAYDQAMAVYKQKFAQYEQKRKEKLAQRERRKFVMDSTFKAQENIYRAEKQVFRTFRLSSFGIYNVDRLIKDPNLMMVEIMLQDESGKPLNHKRFQIVNEEYNAIFTGHQGMKVRFVDNGKNLIWSVTPEGKLAYLLATDLNKQALKKGKNILKLKVHPEKITSLKQLGSIFKLLKDES